MDNVLKQTIFFGLLWLSAVGACAQQPEVHYTLTGKDQQIVVKNPSVRAQHDMPVVIALGRTEVDSAAVVDEQGISVAYQLDDLDGDGRADELCFLTDLSGHQKRNFMVHTYGYGHPTVFKDRTFAQIVLPSKNPKLPKNAQDVFVDRIAFSSRTKDPYHAVHGHGMMFENELLALRVYFDQRQTVDLYGKRHQGLELQATQFYPSEEQLQEGYGDDVLWVGNTYGLGALRGWDGSKSLLLNEVRSREQRVIAYGPVRTVVEMHDIHWIPSPGMPAINATIRYTFYAGHRDIRVDVFLDGDTSKSLFATGLVNVKGSEEYSDHQGLRACWGSDWPTGKDDGKHQLETVGLAISIPQEFLVKEMPATKDDYTMVVRPCQDVAGKSHLTYYILYTSKKEDYGFASAKDWFRWLKDWKNK